MGAYLAEGNGQGTCGLCGENIKRGQLQIVVWGYRFSQRTHLRAEDCPKIKTAIEEGLEDDTVTLTPVPIEKTKREPIPLDEELV